MRIAIVSGSGLVIEILRHVVTSQPRHQVAWVASTGADAVKRIAGEKPDLVLMDLFLPGMVEGIPMAVWAAFPLTFTPGR